MYYTKCTKNPEKTFMYGHRKDIGNSSKTTDRQSMVVKGIQGSKNYLNLNYCLLVLGVKGVLSILNCQQVLRTLLAGQNVFFVFSFLSNK